MSRSLAECAGVNGSDHLAENLCRLIFNRDFRMKASRKRGTRRWADDDSREGKQIVGLDDHGVATTFLNVTSLAWELDPMNITPNHAASP
jgi:hypothetical protein